jgi:hypothetical protein
LIGAGGSMQPDAVKSRSPPYFRRGPQRTPVGELHADDRLRVPDAGEPGWLNQPGREVSIQSEGYQRRPADLAILELEQRRAPRPQIAIAEHEKITIARRGAAGEPVQNGKADYTISVTATFQPSCNPPMTVSFTDIVLTDTTNNLTANIPGTLP